MTTRILLVAAIALTASCTMTHHVDPCTEDPTHCADAGTSPDAGNHDAGTDLGMPDLRGPDVYLSARIEPADATIRCDGTQSFRFFVTLVGGGEVELLPDWTSETPALGTMSTSGVFTPRAGCIASGRARVTASATDGIGTTVTGTATVAVRIELPTELHGVATAADGDAAFASPVGTGAASPVMYPLDGAVMPNNVLPPDIQWTGGASGDLYRVTVQNPSISLQAYVAHTGSGFTYDWTPPSDLWRFVAENYDSGVDVTVDRFDSRAHTVIAGTPAHIRLTRSSIAGSVYYWGIQFPSGPGEFDRIQAGTGERDQILAGIGCVGCHSVSQDGHYLAGIVGGGSGSEPGYVFDLTGDVTATPPPTTYPRSAASFFFSATLNPDNTRMFETTNYAKLVDPMTGATIATATGLPPADSDHAYFGADWSPDGSAIVMTHIDVTTAPWGHKFSHSDLSVIPVDDPATDAFGAEMVLHAGNDLITSPEGGRADNYATWSHDDNWIAFQHGDWSRSTQGTGDTFSDGWSSAAIYILSRDGAQVQRLDNAVAGTHGHKDYYPTFAPFISVEPDGARYMWIAFTSGRRYGNVQTGTAGLDPLAGRQIWVTALDMGTSEIPGPLTADPSHVPYWLPGQNTHLENLGARWAPFACRAAPSGCAISSDCCTGYCAPDTSGRLACATPPAGMCRMETQSCETSADCCHGLTCIANSCVYELH